ncbi:MAG: vitamin K epoxide reductase family protein [Patescibacteria group bacterium]
MTENIILLALSVVGFLVSYHIHVKKKKAEKLVCFVGKDCDKVIHSEYNALIFGIHNEVLGMLYYGFAIVLTVLPFLGVIMLLGFPLTSVLLVVSGLAALFSVLLTFIQLFLLKEICEYCLVSAAVSIAMFVVRIF